VFVDHLQLADFRSYAVVDVALGPGVSVFVGANGQGKTNLVEAVAYLSTLSSHRVAADQPLVRAGAERAIVRARVQAGLDDPRQLQLEVEITPGSTNRARLNRSPLRRPRELLGVLRTVLFAPEDLAVVKGDPSERRRFLDELIVARWPRDPGRLRPGAAAAQHAAQVTCGPATRIQRGDRWGQHDRRLGQPPGGGWR
jgi:DNA replication and repair protein RecF